MEKTYLQWNVVNWITVMLMATVGVAIVGAAAALVQGRTGTATTGE
jgi:hypothetical protein